MLIELLTGSQGGNVSTSMGLPQGPIPGANRRGMFSNFFKSFRSLLGSPLIDFQEKILTRTFLLMTCYLFNSFEAKMPTLCVQYYISRGLKFVRFKVVHYKFDK